MSTPEAGSGPPIATCAVHGCAFAVVDEDRLTALAAHYALTHPELAVVRCCDGGCPFVVCGPQLADAGVLLRGHFSGERGCRAAQPRSSTPPAQALEDAVTAGLYVGAEAGVGDGDGDEDGPAPTAAAGEAVAAAPPTPKLACCTTVVQAEAVAARRGNRKIGEAPTPDVVLGVNTQRAQEFMRGTKRNRLAWARSDAKGERSRHSDAMRLANTHFYAGRSTEAMRAVMPAPPARRQHRD